MAATKKTVSDPAGIWKFAIDLSMVDACSTEKVIICAYVVQNMMVVAHMGSSLIIIFNSSTLVTEHSFQGFGVLAPEYFSKSPSVIMEALSKKLKWQPKNKTDR